MSPLLMIGTSKIKRPPRGLDSLLVASPPSVTKASQPDYSADPSVDMASRPSVSSNMDLCPHPRCRHCMTVVKDQSWDEIMGCQQCGNMFHISCYSMHVAQRLCEGLTCTRGTRVPPIASQLTEPRQNLTTPQPAIPEEAESLPESGREKLQRQHEEAAEEASSDKLKGITPSSSSEGPLIRTGFCLVMKSSSSFDGSRIDPAFLQPDCTTHIPASIDGKTVTQKSNAPSEVGFGQRRATNDYLQSESSGLCH